jgi:hypothetical protein
VLGVAGVGAVVGTLRAWRARKGGKGGGDGYEPVPSEDVDVDVHGAGVVEGASDEETLAEEPVAGPSSSTARPPGADVEVKSYNTFD